MTPYGIQLFYVMHVFVVRHNLTHDELLLQIHRRRHLGALCPLVIEAAAAQYRLQFQVCFSDTKSIDLIL